MELHEILSKARLSLCVQIWPGRNSRTPVQGLRLEQIHGIVEQDRVFCDALVLKEGRAIWNERWRQKVKVKLH